MKNLRKYAPLFVLLVVAMGAPTFTIYCLWPIVSELGYSALLTIIGLVMLIHLERHLWPLIRECVERL